jgi:hypothetical protein
VRFDNWTRSGSAKTNGQHGERCWNEEADLSFPIILSASGAVMDGMHRIVKASLQNKDSIEAVQFDDDPEPDSVGLEPHELSY